MIRTRPVSGNDGLSRDLGKFRPLFLLAPARSCSSVAVAMLGQHPRLYGFPELRLFRAARVGELFAEPAAGDGMSARERAAGLLRALAQLHDGQQSPESADRAWQWLRQRQGWDVAAVFDELLHLIAPVTGVEKSPETSLTDEALARAAHAYPQARYVHLVRHPWSTVASMTATWGPLHYWHVPRDKAAQFCATVWLEQHRRILDFGARLGQGRFLRLRAEDIVNQPGDTLAFVCRWLGIEDDAEHVAAMSAPELSPYASPGPPNASGGFDPTFLRRPCRRDVTLPASLLAPASWRLERDTYYAVIGLARRLGYGEAGQSVTLGKPGLGRHRLPSATCRGRAEARHA